MEELHTVTYCGNCNDSNVCQYLAVYMFSFIQLFTNLTKSSSGLCFGMNIFPSLKAIVNFHNAFNSVFVFHLFFRSYVRS